MGVFFKYFQFFREALDSTFPWGKSWVHISAPLNLATDKMERVFLMPFLGLGLSIAPPPGNFSADALGYNAVLLFRYCL